MSPGQGLLPCLWIGPQSGRLQLSHHSPGSALCMLSPLAHAPFQSSRSTLDRPQKTTKGAPDSFLFFSPFLSFLKPEIRGKRERSPPLPEIMQSSIPHLGTSQGSAHPKCNG